MRKSVAILTPQFFDFNGDKCFFGGGERYLIDIANLLKKQGFYVEAYQCAHFEWSKVYEGLRINGIGHPRFVEDVFPDLNEEFQKRTQHFAHHLYLCFDMVYPYVTKTDSIAISHGVWWDSAERPWWRTPEWMEKMKIGLTKPAKIVSVDTNTLNWVRAVIPEIYDENKFEYIPNYVDIDKFKPKKKVGNSDKFTVLFPRRLTAGRGFFVTLNVAKKMTAEYNDIEFLFVGRGCDAEEELMEQISKENPQIRYKWYEMIDMEKAYEQADLVLIPTTYCEGTSLSCLEAMGFGKPIISGCVGGLTDLVIPGYNGELILINEERLYDTIVELANDEQKCKEYGKNARAMAEKAFSKSLWEERWIKVFKDVGWI